MQIFLIPPQSPDQIKSAQLKDRTNTQKQPKLYSLLYCPSLYSIYSLNPTALVPLIVLYVLLLGICTYVGSFKLMIKLQEEKQNRVLFSSIPSFFCFHYNMYYTIPLFEFLVWVSGTADMNNQRSPQKSILE